MKFTRYFEQEVMAKRPYLKLEWLARIVAEPLRTERQEDGRIRYWGFVEALGRVVRVVTLEDGTVHNAFPDRTFRD